MSGLRDKHASAKDVRLEKISKFPELNVSVELYKLMLKIRRTEERVVEIYPSDKIQSPVHLSIGQEAVSAGVCRALGREDRIYGTYRGHGLFIAKGGDLKKMMAELYGKDTGCARGKGGSMHLVAPEVGLNGCSAVVASTIPVATGDALASQMQGRARVVVAFFGDGAVDEGVFFESVNFAALKCLPIIFVCENNGYAIHSRVSDRHKGTQLYRYGECLGVSGHQHDGNDVFTVYTTMLEAVMAVRQGMAPVLLEYLTYRWHEHVGPGRDHHEAYRNQEALALALANDPLQRARTVLTERFGTSEADFSRWEQTVLEEIDEAVRFAEESPFPGPERLCEDLYEGSV